METIGCGVGGADWDGKGIVIQRDGTTGSGRVNGPRPVLVVDDEFSSRVTTRTASA